MPSMKCNLVSISFGLVGPYSIGPNLIIFKPQSDIILKKNLFKALRNMIDVTQKANENANMIKNQWLVQMAKILLTKMLRII